jgi:hypothetical protein
VCVCVCVCVCVRARARVKMILFELLKQYPAFTELEGSTSYLQDQVTGSYPEPADSNRKEECDMKRGVMTQESYCHHPSLLAGSPSRNVPVDNTLQNGQRPHITGMRITDS